MRRKIGLRLVFGAFLFFKVRLLHEIPNKMRYNIDKNVKIYKLYILTLHQRFLRQCRK